MPPLRLTDSQITAIFAAARPLAVQDRDPFLQEVAAALQGIPDPGDGDVARAPQSALIEVGAALGAGKQVYLVAPHNWSFQHHPRVRRFVTLEAAITDRDGRCCWRTGAPSCLIIS
jgi:hypothetical protein